MILTRKIAIADTGIHREYPGLLWQRCTSNTPSFCRYYSLESLSCVSFRHISWPLCFVGENLKYRKPNLFSLKEQIIPRGFAEYLFSSLLLFLLGLLSTKLCSEFRLWQAEK